MADIENRTDTFPPGAARAVARLRGKVVPGSGLHGELPAVLALALSIWRANTLACRDTVATDRTGATTADTLAALTVVHDVVRPMIDQLESELISQSRQHGATWDTIAPAVGCGDRRGAQAYSRRLTTRAPEDQL
ncbi:hypothetical protein [Actinokineospora cianjurensis]|uniref:Uncharacterized protein n=1 Tax=Actinokineospora cianjurensis TaxID=585224 RepID=A0A421AWC9_9PSEU|nr:hypothetical protein [Actinokineospora cianjurensis]RLK53817.1 hypothetical protein CLV68_6481 [Actinokineospora cianjurensis]